MIKYRIYNSKGYTETLEKPPFVDYEVIEFEPEVEVVIDHIKASLALDLLNKSDVGVLRCYERGIPVPQEWINYRDALRRIYNNSGEDIPDLPEYP